MIQEYLREKYAKYLDGLDIYENRTSIKLPRIIIKKEFRNEGIGSKIMADLVAYADKNNQIIVLTPAKDFGGSVNRLIQFYKRFGFKPNKGVHKSFEFIFANMELVKKGLSSHPVDEIREYKERKKRIEE